MAARGGDAEAVSAELARPGAMVDGIDALGLTALHAAAAAGHAPVVELLLAAGAKADKRAILQGGGTALHLAASKGHAKVAELLLGGGASVQAKDKAGWTPLQLAMRADHLELARKLYGALLLAQGIPDAQAKTAELRPELVRAAKLGKAASPKKKAPLKSEL